MWGLTKYIPPNRQLVNMLQFHENQKRKRQGLNMKLNYMIKKTEHTNLTDGFFIFLPYALQELVNKRGTHDNYILLNGC